jgi:hypothetical protein
MADAIVPCDPTRPIIADAEKDLCNLKTVNFHYIEGYNVSPGGSIYSWTNSLVADKPTGVGEFITDYGPAENIWWQGTWCRGLRYINFTDIRPYTTQWAVANPASPAAINLGNSFAPVALFDKSYDDLGIDPVRNGNFPSLTAGSTVNRTLILYNDEFQDSIVKVTVELKSGTATFATGTKSYELTLGNHMDIPCSFQVPFAGGSNFNLVLNTGKGAVAKFSEAKRFNVTGSSSGTSSSVITLGGQGTAVRR